MTHLRRGVLVLLVAIATVAPTPPGATGQSSPTSTSSSTTTTTTAPPDDPACERAEALAEDRLLTSAVALLDDARTRSQACGVDADAQAVRALARDATELVAVGEDQEAAQASADAYSTYLEALAINLEEAGALAGIQRLEGTAPPAADAKPEEDPFAGALLLLELGREEQAKTAALAAVEKGDTLGVSEEQCKAPAADVAARCELRALLATQEPSGVVGWFNDLFTGIGSVLRGIGAFFSSWWKLIAGIVALAFFAWFSMSRHRRGWFHAPSRLLVSATDESGLECKLLDSMATRVREDLARQQIRNGRNARYVVDSNLAIDLPPLEGVPEQAKFLAALGPWIRKQRAVTLEISLLPPTRTSVSCHVAITDPSGKVLESEQAGRAERIITTFGAHPWDEEKETPLASSDEQITALVRLIAAWTSFQYAVRFDRKTDGYLSTTDPVAHGLFLDGVARLELDPRHAAGFFRQAALADPDLRDASLNLGHALELSGQHEEAQETLGTLADAASTHLAESLATTQISELSLSAMHNLDLLVRATYSRCFSLSNVVAINLDGFSHPATSEGERCHQARQELQATSEELSQLIHRILTSPGVDLGLQTLAIALADHAEAFRHAAADLARKAARPAGERFPTLLRQTGSPRSVRTYLATLATTDRAARLHYTAATIWARDARLCMKGVRGGPTTEQHADAAKAAARVAAQLDKAFAKEPAYADGWKEDHDFADIVEEIEPFLKADPPKEPAEPERLEVSGGVKLEVVDLQPT